MSFLLALLASLPTADHDSPSVAHWPFSSSLESSSESSVDIQIRPLGAPPAIVILDGHPAARFDDPGTPLEIVGVPAPASADFTISCWVRLDPRAEGDPGDILSCYDPDARNGFLLSLRTNTGVTTNQSNLRQLQFSIDAGSEPSWEDAGRPGQTVYPFALSSHDGALYAGTAGNSADDPGHVYRHEPPDQWVDLGSPDRANAVSAFAVHEGKLHAGTARYRFAGSALPDSPNDAPGGGIYRLDGDRWTEIGRLPDRDAIGGLVVFQGRLHASSLYKPAGFFRLEPDGSWTTLPLPNGARVESLAVHDRAIYAGSYDGGHVYLYDGEAWTDLGILGDNTQTYSFAEYGGLCVGTWPSGHVYRLRSSDPPAWEDLGRLGEEREVMGMIAHAGKLYAGTLPLAQVYRFDGPGLWTLTARLDHTPDVTYRRAWTMATHDGRLFCSTLPSGRIHALTAGAAVTLDRAFPDGWHHVAAIKQADRLRLVLDGHTAVQSAPFDPDRFHLEPNRPLLIGGGPASSFRGAIRDLRIHHRALDDNELNRLASPTP